jgi:long-chain-fatty-acid--[acyl-carrier-protein] ligase
MTRFFWNVFCWKLRLMLSLRYRIEVRGLETISPERLKGKQGILFMPNHSAHMDPLMVVAFLWPRFRFRPLVVEYIYRIPWLQPLMKVMKALPIPNFETSVNQLKIRKAEQAVTVIADGLKKGENFLLYPSGKLKNTPQEIVGGSSAAHDILQEYSKMHVVLIRTTGLWGSSFSRALTGRAPDLVTNLKHGIKAALKSLIFFLPRRKVLIEIEADPADFPRTASRMDLNRYLEQWYNRYEDEEGHVWEKEPIQLVSYSCWHREIPKVYQPKERPSGPSIAISPKTSAKIIAVICKIIEKPGLEIHPEMNLATDLGMDSLQIAELISYVGQNYNIEDVHPEDLETVQNVLEIAEGARTNERPAPPSTARWPAEEKERPASFLPMGRTLPEAFLRCCDQMGEASACGDDLVGVLSYKKLKLNALVLAGEIRRWPDEYIGVMLPASAGAFVVILAIQLAGKIPVMMNWTLGSRSLEEMAKIAKVEKVISSWRFLEKLSHVNFGKLIDSILFIEDIRSNLKLKTKLTGLLRSRFRAKTIMRTLRLHQLSENRPAVILFTSGTEASPKGVPLSHYNILSNLRAAMGCIDLNSRDCFYCVLPPFHSFGFSVAGMVPILSGIKVAFYPDPTDSFALADGINRWKITVFLSAPSFLKGVFQAAKKEQLASVRYFVTGAEKAPPEILERIAQLGTGAQLLEGYGITECSPILTLTPPNRKSKGVGIPLPNVEFCIIHSTTHALVPSSTEGEICVRGPNVFNGYLGNPRSAFVEIKGERWYRTGDIGHIDAEGNVIISGRLKRFVKIGGEMISLGAIEEVINAELIRQQRISPDVPSLAVCADEKEQGKPQLILFTTLSINAEEVNDILRQSGFSRLIKIAAVRNVPEIPLLGIGKTDYRSLQTQIA